METLRPLRPGLFNWATTTGRVMTGAGDESADDEYFDAEESGAIDNDLDDEYFDAESGAGTSPEELEPEPDTGKQIREKVLDLERRIYDYLAKTDADAKTDAEASTKAYEIFAHADVYLLMATYLWELFSYLAGRTGAPRTLVYTFVTQAEVSDWLRDSGFRLFKCDSPEPKTIFVSVLNQCYTRATQDIDKNATYGAFLGAYGLGQEYDMDCAKLPFGLYKRGDETRVLLEEDDSEVSKFKEACVGCDADIFM